MEPIEITAGRLHLRPWQPADAPAVYAACQDPEIQRWTTVPSPYAEEDARSFVEEMSPAGWAGDNALFAVLDAVSGQLLASVGAHRLAAADGIAEVGYWAAREARGRGVVTQSVGVLARWVFAAHAVARLEWYAEVGNVASRRVAEKAGFTIEGTLRSRLVQRGRRIDAWVGSLLPDEI